MNTSLSNTVYNNDFKQVFNCSREIRLGLFLYNYINYEFKDINHLYKLFKLFQGGLWQLYTSDITLAGKKISYFE